MSKNPFLSSAVDRYVTETISRETPLMKRVREETSHMRQAQMQISADEGEFLAMLVRLVGAKRVIEIGTFTGYSALRMASALPEGGKLVACDVSKEWTDVAQRYWQEAGLSGRIELRLGAATETLAHMIAQNEPPFDLAFIDADKGAYDEYYEACLYLLRPGGVIALDNMLWSGAVADPSEQDAQTKALRSLNAKIRDDDRVDMCLLTIADGVMLARKR